MQNGFSIQPLITAKQFPLDAKAYETFYNLEQLLMKTALHRPDNTKLYMIECDASDEAVSANLNQVRRPVAFMSRTLNRYETHYPAIEKEATAVIEAVRKWSHFLSGQHFTILKYQKSVVLCCGKGGQLPTQRDSRRYVIIVGNNKSIR